MSRSRPIRSDMDVYQHFQPVRDAGLSPRIGGPFTDTWRGRHEPLPSSRQLDAGKLPIEIYRQMIAAAVMANGPVRAARLLLAPVWGGLHREAGRHRLPDKACLFRVEAPGSRVAAGHRRSRRRQAPLTLEGRGNTMQADPPPGPRDRRSRKFFHEHRSCTRAPRRPRTNHRILSRRPMTCIGQ